jgi:hypothetical protein
MIAPATLSTESFFAMPKPQQADLIWEHLFRERLPISEAQIGIVTTLQALGLSKEVEAKDLNAIRKWFAQQVGSVITEEISWMQLCLAAPVLK